MNVRYLMGYRHQVMSDTMVPSLKSLPTWFCDKYESLIDFDHSFWVSNSEYKRYGLLSEFDKDVQKVLIERGGRYTVRLVYFADESDTDDPDIIHTTITSDEIKEIRPREWSVD